MIPNCYDPVYQAERFAMEQDKLMENTMQCTACGKTLYPGDKFHKCNNLVICPSCLEEMNDSLETVE
jgi:predicted RNA-binding Zn-ribbon protein involved in translation (DUF1610 family)